MDDFTGLLARDFGLKPQGKSAPMAPQSNSSAADFNSFASSYNFANAAGKKFDPSPVFDDLGRDGDDLLFKDVFSGPPPKYGSSSGDSRSPSAPAFDYDAMFKEPKSKSASVPVYDKPVYDDEDVFESIPELQIPSTSSHSARFENVFSSISTSPAKHRKQNSSPFDDLMGTNLGKTETDSDRENKGSSVFDDLIPGFGRTNSPPPKRSTSETSQSQKSPYQPAKTSSNLVEEDPFVVLEESASTPRDPSTGGFNDPLEDIGKFNSRKTDHASVHGGVFVEIDPLDSLGKSGPDMNSRSQSHLKQPANISGSQSPVESSRSYHSKKASFDDVLEPQNTSAPPPTSTEGSFESSDDVWLTVSEIPLFTEPTSAPPPARPPPPRPTRPVKKKVNEPSISSSTNHHSYVPSSARASVNSPTASQMDELDDFSMGRKQTAANGHPEPTFGEDSDVFSAAVASAAAMKDAMDKAEAKFRHAKERREKENLKASRSREGDHMENHDSRERELREKQVRLERERAEREAEMEKAQDKEREDREREQKRIERERERLLARQAVERATREARERAAAEAHAKVQRAAVGKASDARERAERAAVQRAHAEARERAAAGAREKAEKAAAEARERVNAEAQEKEARVRAERAAVERAAAEARGRAAAQAKAKQQQENNSDLDSFFNSVSRPNSAPQQRTNPLDPFQDSWNKGGSFESSRPSSQVSSRATENLRKTSSTTNIVDDLSSIFGAPASQSGGFQDVDGETEERRRARLERHQRTQERAAKALAEKNERDLQVQREQVEKDRIGVTLDVEIKRWGAGKEGNLRALLSTLQYVLWPECGWQPVSLTDLITAASVKKVYRKATLCIHPDKVQQKGANLQQKYIAEKVFDMLKEAWNKFNSEELF
ncbi:PREDICTED: auxilin-related protein 2 isoform X1 [Camelina sativa]|uniref:Auxilin-related protein 2 isoform X1 n=1 Tax=Camelina sativa TaxID=90675 RepID=A0ABM0UG15_CAMSA|nr:PREDICTED: auxilin-related protein 2 isoform X1 [Camelina sativa]